MLEFDGMDKCGCEKITNDPEEDVTRRINKEIRKTIGDLLSSIVH